MECPVCGNKRAKVKWDSMNFQFLYGEKVPFKFKVTDCSNCKESVSCADFDDHAKPAIQKAMDSAKMNILFWIKNKTKYSWGETEHALYLSYGFFKELSQRNITKTELALLTMIRTNPSQIQKIWDLGRKAREA
jgi:hypothetical protein